MKKKDIATGAVGLALLGTTAAGLAGWYDEHRRVADLESQVAELKLQEKRSSVVRSVSKQMEEIAYQQKEISDEQREEAIQQKRTAEEMRHRSEVERQNALIAQEKAVVSEQQAQEARLVAESERQMADHQRVQAEFSKRVADTLSYVTLGRSLGSLSLVQSRLGNTDLAALLAYASYLYVDRYKADVYYPAVFQSLMTASQSKRTWFTHRGALMGVDYASGNNNSLVTVSSYGEVVRHLKQGDQLRSDILLSNKDYDFRDVYIDEDSTIYAISRSGHLAIIRNNAAQVIPIEALEHPMGVVKLDDTSVLLIGDRGLGVYDKQRRMIVATREFDFHLTAASRYDNMPILFDDRGRQHIVKDINDLQTSEAPVSGRVTAFASSKTSKRQVFGMSDGTIYLYDEKDQKLTKLEGHLSRISKLKLNNLRLVSSSYDGTVKFWNTASAKIEPMTMLTADSWIMNFDFDNSKNYAWIGDRNGNLMEALLSVPMLVDLVRKNLKRNFTQDEWDYYIGKNVPYEEFVNDSRKEVRP
ncbi:MAG: hypothetical protein J6Y33_08125 [Prevotella sp.]|nr:hypothetical protein [Prevotella sp.]